MLPSKQFIKYIYTYYNQSLSQSIWGNLGGGAGAQTVGTKIWFDQGCEAEPQNPNPFSRTFLKYFSWNTYLVLTLFLFAM